MIDLDRLEERLELSLTDDLRAHRAATPPAPTTVAGPRSRVPAPPMAAAAVAGSGLDVADHARRVAELLGSGDRGQVDHHVGAHAALARETGRLTDQRDAASLAAMQALLDGRRSDARAASDLVLSLGGEADDPESADRSWAQRFWVVLEWGDVDERHRLLDHCREQAYRHDQLPWFGALALLLARVGRPDEAGAAFDAAAARGLEPAAPGGAWLELATDLAEAAALLGDARRAALVHKALARTTTPLVVVGRGWVCKGSTARFRALAASAAGRAATVDADFLSATETHRRLGAGVLLARTLTEWGNSLRGRDDLRSRSYLQEGADLGRRLALADFVAPAAARAS
jgi:hypothetical protein